MADYTRSRRPVQAFTGKTPAILPVFLVFAIIFLRNEAAAAADRPPVNPFSR
jgi:hypothetical protein